MLYLIQNLADRYINLVEDDPVRPHISVDQRLGAHRQIFVSCENEQPQAVTCVSLANHVPESEHDLFTEDQPSVAVFYTIWSYSPGSGRQLILDSVKYIQSNYPDIRRFVTLSPKTEMAYRFHIRNGARVLRENTDTVNYEYLILNIGD